MTLLRKELIEIAIEERSRDQQTLKAHLITEKSKLKNSSTESLQQKELLKKLEAKSEVTARQLNKKINKKVSFHLEQRTEITFAKKKKLICRKEKKTEHRKRKNRQNYRRNKKRKKKEKIEELVSKIKDENIVVNLSNEEIPASAYLFLAKGLGYVTTKKVDLQDLKYDTLEFIRKMEWKAYFHENPDLTTGTDPMALYSNIKISNFNQAPTQNSIIGELKTKLLGWIANHEAKAPKSNLTELEQRDKKWVSEKIKEELIFITKADKGGATLIMNYKDVEDAVKKEIFDETKFERIATSADEHILTMRNKVNQLSINLQTNNIISKADKSLITGLSDKNKPKQAPEYRAESPYAYPSFKIHKLSANDIAEKKDPSCSSNPCIKVQSLVQM